MEKQRSKVDVCALRSGRACGCGASPTRTFDLLSSLQRRLLVVDGLAGQREDPDLRHLPQQLLVAAAERQDLAALRWVLHHLSGSEETAVRVATLFWVRHVAASASQRSSPSLAVDRPPLTQDKAGFSY